MLPYFYVLGFIAIMATLAPARRVHYLTWGLAFSILLIFIGLRHKVGMDWNNYLFIVERLGKGDLHSALSDQTEPGFVILTWISTQLNLGIYGINFAGTLIFLMGLFKFAKSTPHPWMAILAALPMLCVVVAMSASRQIIAIGIILWLAATWNSKSIPARAAFVLLASAFHQSAIFFLAPIILQSKLNSWLKYGLALAFTVIAILVLQATGYAEYYDDLYISGQTDATKSEAALLHVLYNAGPAFLVITIRRLRNSLRTASPMLFLMAIASLALVPISLAYSTAAARMTMYFYPVAMWTFAALPELVNDSKARRMTRYFFSLFFAGVLLFWLSFSNSRHAYIPYGNFLTTPSYELRLCC